jgi:hypothetical protein
MKIKFKIIFLLFGIFLTSVGTKLIKVKEKAKKRELSKIIDFPQVQIFELLIVIIIVFVFFSAPIWAIGLFSLPLIFLASKHLYKFGTPVKCNNRLLEDISPGVKNENNQKLLAFKQDMINPEKLDKELIDSKKNSEKKIEELENILNNDTLLKENEDQIIKYKIKTFEYLSNSKYKLKKELDARSLSEIVQDYVKVNYKIKNIDSDLLNHIQNFSEQIFANNVAFRKMIDEETP